MKKKIFIIFVLLFCGVILFLLASGRGNIFLLRKSPRITLTSEGFVPKKVVIRKGDEVTFGSKDFDFFWPASSMHPNHSIYPEFDPRGPVSKSGSWSFVFDSVGSWDYHDHLQPFFGGTVIVLDDNFLVEREAGCSDLSKLSLVQKQKCWYFEVRKVADNSGSGVAMDLLAKLYDSDSDFQQHCHDMTHLIGEMAYKEYASGGEFIFDTRTTYCGYGFYHGFIEALSFGGGDLLELRDFCLSLGKRYLGDVANPTMEWACFHGIGHAVFDNHDTGLRGNEKTMVEASRGVCKSVTDGLEWFYFKQCMTGVYNALGLAYSNNEYGLSMRDDDPTWFCRLESDDTRKYCYAEVVPAWIFKKYGLELSFDNVIDFVKHIKPLEDAQMSSYTGVAEYAKVNLDIESEVEMGSKCLRVPSGLKRACIEGVGTALTSSGNPGVEHVRAVSLCGSIPETAYEEGQSLKTSCFSHVLGTMTTMYSADKFMNICSQLDEKHKELCKKFI